MHPQLNIAVAAAREGAHQLARQFDRLDRVRRLDSRPGGEIITSAHVEVEHTLLQSLQKAHPRHGIQSSISGQSGDENAETQWLIDPLWGSDNFLRSTPGFGVAIACRVGKRIQTAALVEALLNDEYTAVAGGGAKLGDRRLRVSDATDLENTLVALQLDSDPAGGEPLAKLVRALIEAGAGIRSSGCGVKDLLDVAAGRLAAGRILANSGPAVSAALMVLHEAGGLSGDEKGNPDPTGDWLLFGNPRCFRQMLKTGR